MRIVTLVTLIFLPATFVSTLFSTDIIKYQVDEYPDGKFSQVAMNRWLQVTVPLTLLTLLTAWCGKQWASGPPVDGFGGGDVTGTVRLDRLKDLGRRIWSSRATMGGSRAHVPNDQGKGDAGPFP